MIEVQVQNVSSISDIPSVEKFHRWIQTALESQSQAEITIRLVNKDESAKINTQWRQKTQPTNILSFTIMQASVEQPILVGDLIICPSVVIEEATSQQVDTDEYWAHIVVHGCYHLLGYDHQTDTEASKMEQLESQTMQKLGYTSPHGDILDA